MAIKTRIAAIITSGKKVLFVKGRNYNDLWTPGGKAEIGESDEDCLRRELKEELNVELVSMNFYKKYLTKSPYNDYMVETRLYQAKIKGNLKPGMEITEFIWLGRDDFEKKRYSTIPVNQEKIIPDLIKSGII